MKTNKSRQIKLAIPNSLLARIEQELDFLGVGLRLVVLEDQAIESRNGFIRLVANQYCMRDRAVAPIIDDSFTYITFYLDRQTQGLWETAISDGLATSYHDLIAAAFGSYFDRQEELAKVIAGQVELYREKLKTVNLSELREFVA
jgi:hypothetical protein